MPVYNFKTLGKVPDATAFIDAILSKTQRKTPTVVRRGWKISRIRSFYMRKVKFTQENYTEKLERILREFPRLDDVHPFYADLINVLYSRDHYKLALAQLSTARTTVDTLGKDYIRLLKFADSLYRAKELKRAALGRMCTCMKKLNSSLAYLEQVRQHLARLPSIDPDSRTLMITGYPNVGKSSFINQLSRADVEVQPYAFTTKSLFVGHFDHKYTRWQVIDTPGILDHPLEDRNTIEMQAITALAHLQSTVLYFIDISESCGYTIEMQCSLFHSIKPLFVNKPLLIVVNKIDLKAWDDVDPADRALIEGCAKDRNTKIMQMSNQSGTGVNEVKTSACDMLVVKRVANKVRNSTMVNSVAGRIAIVRPEPRDRVNRSSTIPESVRRKRAAKRAGMAEQKKQTLQDIEIANGGPGIFNFSTRNHWHLTNPEWKFDAIPEIMDGKNIADFVDPDIERRLLELEEEEIDLLEEAANASEDMDSDLDEETVQLANKIVSKRKVMIAEHNTARSANKPVMPRRGRTRTLEGAASHLQNLGLDTQKFARTISKSRTRKPKRGRDEANMVDSDDEWGDDHADKKLRGRSKTIKDRARSKSIGAHDKRRSTSRAVSRNERGMSGAREIGKAEVMRKKQQKKMAREARKGEADRHVPDFKPKHLYSGKSGMGTRDWR